MNCIAIDDEQLALNIIEEYCRKVDYLNLQGVYTNAIDAIPEINRIKPELIFLDVEMPNITGLDFIKCLPDPPLIILTTAFSKYAINGFDLNVVDYLLKPFPFEKFLKAVNKATIYISAKYKPAGETKTEDQDQFILVKADCSVVKVRFDSVCFIEGLKDYIKIYINEKPLITKSTIKYFESRLPAKTFVRVHKSFIVSLDKIEKIEYNHIFIGQKRIPIGMQFKDDFYRKIDQFRL